MAARPQALLSCSRVAHTSWCTRGNKTVLCGIGASWLPARHLPRRRGVINEERRGDHPRTEHHAPCIQQWLHCSVRVFGRRRLAKSCSRCPVVLRGKAEPQERRAWPRECVGHSWCLSRGSVLKRQTSRPETPRCRLSQLAAAFAVVRDVPIMLRLVK